MTKPTVPINLKTIIALMSGQSVETADAILMPPAEALLVASKIQDQHRARADKLTNAILEIRTIAIQSVLNKDENLVSDNSLDQLAEKIDQAAKLVLEGN